MLLAIDIGNTNIVIGGINDGAIAFEARIATDRIKTSDQYGAEIKSMLNLFDVKPRDVEDCIISSVVPPVFNSVRTGVVKVIGKQPMVVGPGIKTGLNIQMDNPSQVGSDRIVIAVAALANSLLRLASKIDVNRMKHPSFLMVLTATGTFAYRRKDNVLVVPISTLGA